MRIYHLPKWQDTLTLQTQPTGIDGIYFGREFILKNENNDVMIEADSKWVIINKETQRPLTKVEEQYHHLLTNSKLVATEFARLKEKKELSYSSLQDVANSDIDLHHHVNNAVFIRWIEDLLAKSEQSEIASFSIQFLKEVKEGEKVIINHSGFGEDLVCFEGLIAGSDVHCFRVEVERK